MTRSPGGAFESPPLRPPGVRLLEREGLLEALAARLREAAAGAGRLVLIGGEAGSGKTSLVRAFTSSAARPVFWGSCEPMATARPLAPFVDIAVDAGGDLGPMFEDMLSPADRARPFQAWLARHPPAVIVVVEDAHWADEASLDLLRTLSARLTSLPVLLVVTYRNDSVDRLHPLRIFLGDVVRHRGVTRLVVPALSPAAVQELAEPLGIDAALLHARSGGNAFIVSEVLASGDAAAVPATVSDAVLARVARMSTAGRSALDLVSVFPVGLPLRLVTAVGADDAGLDECVEHALLREEGGRLAFRHDLARVAVNEVIPPLRRRALHRAVLEALAADPDPSSADLAHHADAAGNAAMVLRYAPLAGAQASALGAHRQAAGQYRRAIRYAGVDSERADLLSRLADECYITGQFDDAIAAQEDAIGCYRRMGDTRRQGDAARALSRLLRYVGRMTEALEVGQRAVALLEQLPPGHETAIAYCNVSHLHMIQDDLEQTVLWGTRALELAARLDDTEALVYALTNVGVVEYYSGAPEAVDKLKRSLGLALEHGLHEHAGRAYNSLVWNPVRHRQFALVGPHLEAGMAFCVEHGLDLWRLFLLASRARMELDQGRWSDAVETAELVLRDPHDVQPPRLVALVVLALVRARRGDPEYAALLEEANALAQSATELQRIGPAAAACAEVAWLEGRHDAVRASTEAALALAVRRRAPWVVGELACWRSRSGAAVDCADLAGGPFGLTLHGAHGQAAAAWEDLGCPYEQALALADAADAASLRRARDIAEALGARPLVARCSRELRALGVRGLPRGVRASTAANRALLTERELEVLGLVAAGLRNAEIAARLFLAPRTVDNHVAAILSKLEATTRTESVSTARRLGLID